MKLFLRLFFALALAIAFAPALAPQARQAQIPRPLEDEPAAPDAKMRDAQLKAEHDKDLKDAAELVDLAQQLKEELEKNDRRVLSIASLKKTEEIEKLAKHIHARLVH